MELADRAVGGDDHIERTVARGLAVDQPARTTGEHGRLDRDAAVDRDPRLGARGGEQRLEQHAAMQPVAVQRGFEVGVAQIDHRATVAAAAQQAIDPRRARRDLIEQPEARERALAGRLQRDPRADRPRHRDALEQRDRMAGAREQDRSRRTGGPGADHGDAKRLHAALLLGVHDVSFAPLGVSPRMPKATSRTRRAWG